MKKIFAIAWKDLLRSTRSLFLIGMAVVAPLLITALMFFALGSMESSDSSALPQIELGIVDSDQLPAGASLEKSLGASLRQALSGEDLNTWLHLRAYSDASAAQAALDAQQIDAVLYIPADFTAQFMLGAQPTALRVVYDPALTITPVILRTLLENAMQSMQGTQIALQILSAQTQDPALSAASAAQYAGWSAQAQSELAAGSAWLHIVTPASADSSSQPSSIALILAGQMIFFSFFTGGYAMLSILHEAEEGTLARQFTTPTARILILSGKFLAVLLTVMLQGAVLLAAGRFFFGVNWGQPGAIALAFGGQMIAAVGLAVLLVALIKTSRQSGPVFGGLLTAMGMLSGLFTTNISMPAGFTLFSRFTPQGWALTAWKLALNGRAASDLLVPAAVLAAIGLALFAAGAWRFNRRFA